MRRLSEELGGSGEEPRSQYRDAEQILRSIGGTASCIEKSNFPNRRMRKTDVRWCGRGDRQTSSACPYPDFNVRRFRHMKPIVEMWGAIILLGLFGTIALLNLNIKAGWLRVKPGPRVRGCSDRGARLFFAVLCYTGAAVLILSILGFV